MSAQAAVPRSVPTLHRRDHAPPAHDAADLHEPEAGTVRLLCIGGTGQNGATLLTRMLGRLPGYVAVGEIGRLWDKGIIEDTDCGCGLTFRGCPFWTRVGDLAFGGWDNVDAARAVALRSALERQRRHATVPRALPMMAVRGVSRSYDAAVDGYLDLLAPLYRAVVAASGGGIIVDSMKVPSHLFALRRLDSASLAVLHLVRHPSGVAHSNAKRVARQGGAPGALRARSTPRRMAARWIWNNVSFEVLARLDVPSLVVEYERLVRRPRPELERIAAFAGTEVSASDLSFVDGRTVVLPPAHVVAGNRVRHQSGPMELREDGAWRTGLGARDRAVISAVTAPLLHRYHRRARSAPATGAARLVRGHDG